MFATYLALAQDAREVVEAYKDKQVDLIAKILADGVAQGVFEIDNVKATARAVFDATVRYHHPAHAGKQPDVLKGARHLGLLGDAEIVQPLELDGAAVVMTAVDLVHRKGHELSDEVIREELEGNLCRCTGYQNIVASIAAGAKAMAKSDLA